jgi:hypothetical protein
MRNQPGIAEKHLREDSRLLAYRIDAQKRILALLWEK